MTCWRCKGTAFETFTAPVVMHGVEVEITGDRCTSCRDETFSLDQVGIAEQQAARVLAMHGELTEAQAKFLCKATGRVHAA